jgi:acyl-CoA reductase-like NAD-dependent aldehyde dehydrogenase
MPVVNPSTEELLAEVAEHGVEDAQVALDAARRAFDSGEWPGLALAERIGLQLLQR